VWSVNRHLPHYIDGGGERKFSQEIKSWLNKQKGVVEGSLSSQRNKDDSFLT